MADAKLVRLLHSEATIRERVTALAAQISADFAGKTLDVVCLLNGASVFSADLVRRLTIPTRVHFLGFTSYPKGNASGEIRITQDVAEPLNGRDVLVVEGIVVSGRTPRYVLDSLALRQPASLSMCVLGKKPLQLTVDLPIQYAAFEFGSEMVVGYGVGSGPERMSPTLIESTS